MITSVITKLSRRTTLQLSLLCALLGVSSTGRAAISIGDSAVQIGGFFSQGYLINSGHNDYLGDTSEGTFDFREYAVNASYAIGKWRVGAQAFGQQLGAYGDDKIKLDWATIDYQPAQWFGLRAGRVKLPRGLYNESLDVDAVRPFVLLPQGVYDARLRDFNAAFNGGMTFGNVGLGRVGSVDYRLFYGEMPMSVRSGANDYFNNDAPFPNLAIGIDHVRGGSLFWNTPVAGLRAGYSYNAFKNHSSLRRIITPVIAIDLYKDAPTYERHLFSVEYTRGDWVFAAEAGKEHAVYGIHAPGARDTGWLDFDSTYYYVSAARRINAWLELGAYYSHSLDEQLPINVPTTIHELRQGDYALSARFDINSHLLFKLEGHYMDGAGKIFNTPHKPQPVPARDNAWTMIAAKVTFMF
jgi:hypothetical protein